MRAQVIKRKCCGVIFAACIEPECYTDREWLTNLKKYVQRGDTVDLVEMGKGLLTVEKCTCKTKEIKEQLPLFNTP